MKWNLVPNIIAAVKGEADFVSRLMVVRQQYPGLKAHQGFSDLRVQPEGTDGGFQQEIG